MRYPMLKYKCNKSNVVAENLHISGKEIKEFTEKVNLIVYVWGRDRG